MNKLLVLLVPIAFIACKNPAEKNSEEKTIVEETTTKIDFEKVDWNTINNKFPDPEEEDGEMLLGKVNFKGLQQVPFKEWFELGQQEHVLDTLAIDSIKPLLSDIDIKVFMGTWCEDSQREIPALYKILMASNYNIKTIEMVAMTHDKDTPSNFEQEYAIEYVPTIILSKNGKELNRIVEYPQQTLEQDLLTILQGKLYKNPYAE